MKSLQSFSEDRAFLDRGGVSVREEIFITPSDVIEYLYCPRFIYYMKCLDIPQHEDERYKVMKGREVHEEKSKINKEYLRKKLGCVAKDISVYLTSSVSSLERERSMRFSPFLMGHWRHWITSLRSIKIGSFRPISINQPFMLS